MLSSGEKQVFLATTALEDFWDTTKPMVFLGPWCRLRARKAYWEQLDAELMPDPFGGREALRAAHRHVAEVYERILPVLGEALNRMHGISASTRYWRIVAGPWLQMYVSVTYERYCSIKTALARYPGLTTTLLSPAAHVVPSTTHDFAAYLLEDSFNLQIYSRVLSALGLAFPARGEAMHQRASYVKAAAPSRKQLVARFASRLNARIASALFPAVLLKDSYFPKQALRRFVTGKPGQILPSFGNVPLHGDWPLQRSMRDALAGLPLGDSEFDRCLAAMLPHDLPLCFAEGYRAVGAAARGVYPRRINAIFSANAWYYDEVFKQWAASCAEGGTKLLGCQHGGNYGALAIMPSEDHETAIVDRYYTWGWERNGRPATVAPMPSPKLIGLQHRRSTGGQGKVLWVATTMPRYTVYFPWTPGEFEEYLDWQRRFATELGPHALAQVRLRPHREDNGWSLATRLAEAIPALAMEGWDVPFQQSLDNCALYVCDHLSTTFIEALAADTPTILFWNADTNALRPEAQPYYDMLRQAGILYHRPEDAAAAVNALMVDVDRWWNEPARRQAVEAFCARFACRAGNAIETWVAELTATTKRVAR